MNYDGYYCIIIGRKLGVDDDTSYLCAPVHIEKCQHCKH